MKRVGIFGGTFDPIHFGHLRSALELRESLGLEQVRMIPCANPPHRDQPSTSAVHRLAMLKIALEDADAEGLIVDDREVLRPDLSYTVDTLLSLQNDFPGKSWLLFIGVDAFSHFTRWHRWQRILELADLVVVTRPQAELSEKSRQLLAQRQVSVLPAETEPTQGHIVVRELTQLDISSTAIRTLFAKEKSPAFLLPAVVQRYIRDHGLYLE